MLPEEWYENGKRLEIAENRLAYFKAGLNRPPEFHPYAWRGIGDALREKGDMSGATIALANEEKARQGVATSIPPELQDSLSANKPNASTARFCPTCGSENPPVAQFCARCGESLSTGVIRHPMQTSQNVQGYPQNSSQSYQDGYQQGYQQGYQHAYPRPSGGSGFGTGGLVCAIIGLIVAAIPMGIIALVLGGIGSSRDQTKGKATAAMCIGVIDILTGIILLAMTMPFYY